MMKFNPKQKLITGFVLMSFLGTTVAPLSLAQEIILPLPGKMVSESQNFTPTMVRGLTIYPKNPLRFDFIIDTGNENLPEDKFEAEAIKLIKYFLSSLTVPENDLWVNLSPYERNRIIPEAFGVTGMGIDLLSQDYILKQLAASLLYPEDALGKDFWQRVRAKAKEKFGSDEIPLKTFNKIWIVPDRAVVYEQQGSVFVAQRHLKVMLEEDFMALNQSLNLNREAVPETSDKQVNGVVSDVVREVLIPEVEKEVNEGKNFGQLRQIYNAMILATWYKKNLKESLLGHVYFNQNKTAGIDIHDKESKLRIYEQYLEAFKKGVYNYIKEDYDPGTQENIAHKYFSGGAVGLKEADLQTVSAPLAQLSPSMQRAVSSPVGKDLKVTWEAVEGLSPAAGPTVQKASALKKSILSAAMAVGICVGCNIAEAEPPSTIQQPPAVSEILPEQQASKSQYWMDLANKDYKKVFERANEFINEPFALDVLKAAVLSKPVPFDETYKSSTELAMSSFERYASHPQALEIAKLAGDITGYWWVYKNFDKIKTLNNGADLIEMALRNEPYFALEQFYRGEYNNFYDAATAARFKAYVEQSSAAIAKTIVAIYKSRYSYEIKLRMTELSHGLVNNWYSLDKAAAFIQGNSYDLFKQLVKIRAIPGAYGVMSQSADISTQAKEIIGGLNRGLATKNLNGVIPKFVQGLSVYETYILIAFGSENINKDSFDYLLKHMQDKLKQSQDPLKDLFSTQYYRGFRAFCIQVARYDRVADFFDIFDTSSVQVLLKEFTEAKVSWWSERTSLTPLEYPFIEFIIAEYLLTRPGLTEAETGYLRQLAENRKRDFLDQPDQSPLLYLVNVYQTRPLMREKSLAALRDHAQNKPDGNFFKVTKYFIHSAEGLAAFRTAAAQNPYDAEGVISESEEVRKALQPVADPVIQLLLTISQMKLSESPSESDEKKQLVALLSDDLINKRLPLPQAVALLDKPFKFMRRLTELKDTPNTLGRYGIDLYSQTFYLKMLQSFNALQLEPDAVQFAALDGVTTVQLYKVMVYGSQEIFTATFNGLFKRLMAGMKRDGWSGERLLQEVNHLRSRSFINMLVNFGSLNEFLATMSEPSRDELLRQFVGGLEKEAESREQAVAVAETFSLVKDPGILMKLQTFVRENYTRVQDENNQQGIAIYGILSGMFSQKAVIDEAWFKEMATKFGLPQVDRLNTDQLFNEQGQNIQRHYFYRDEDGAASFYHFLSFYQGDANWKVTTQKNYVHIVSTRGQRTIEIFANKPNLESEGDKDIAGVFDERRIYPQVVVHRGHNMHVPGTIKQIKNTAVIVSLGSCGGFADVAGVYGQSPDAFILSTKGVGTMTVNDPLGKFLNERILKGGVLVWQDFWQDAGKRITSKDFYQYVSPHRNIGVLFLKAYGSHLAKKEKVAEQTTQVSSSSAEVGGIDLNPALLHLQIKRDGNGFPLPVNQQTIENIRIDGFTPVIINIQPMINLPLFLGLKKDAQPTDLVGML